MKSPTRCLGLAAVAAFILASNPVLAQKSGGVLKIQHMDNPPSASIHEEATFSAVMPFMALYNNLVIFDQHVARNSLESIVPDLATSWTWSVDGKGLGFKLRQGVKWHDGKPFTAKDVACTFDLLTDPEKLRRNPRCSPCSLPATRRSIPATCRSTRCGAGRSAPGRSSSPSSR